MYEYADKIITYLNRQFIEKFGRLKTIFIFDELNVLQATKALYAELDALVREKLFLLANYVYEQYAVGDNSAITVDWLNDILSDYNSVTKYVYEHEVERKCSRLAESLIASPTKNVEIDTALRYWSSMVTQYAIEVTDKVVIQAYKDNGVQRVKWISFNDKRRCKVCERRHGKIYDINKIPPKPHIGCRCYFEAITEG